MKKSSLRSATTKPISKSKQAHLFVLDICKRMNELAMEGKRELIIEDVRKAFQLSKKYQLTKLSTEFASFLQYYYYHDCSERRRGDIFHAEMLKFNEIAHKENIVDGKFARLSFQLNRTRKPSKQLREELDSTCEELKNYLQYESAIIWIHTYMLLNAQAYLNNDFQQIIELSNEVIDYLESNGIERTTHFYKDLTVASILTGNSIDARHAIKKALVGIKKGSSVWSVYVYYRLINEIYSEQYQSAYDLFLQAEKSRQVNKAMYEQWLIVRGYIKFLVECGHIDGNAQFKLGKFLNDMPVFSKDKEGNNINILILKILLRLSKDRGRIIQEEEAINQYVFRYLKNEERPRIFLKMLLQLPKGNFNRIAVERRTEQLEKQLNANQLINPDLEIIPYERLWGMVLTLLK